MLSVFSVLSHLIIPILIVVVIAGLIFVGKALYKQAPPNRAMVVTGPSGSKTVTGKGCLVIPIFQRVDYMSLENIQADFTSRDEIPTKDAINILVDAVANVCISQDPELMKIASRKFLGKSVEEIRDIIIPVLEGNIREIISQTTLKELIQGDKKAFAEKVQDNVDPNLRDMGLELTTFNIQNFKDRNGVIENLGIQNIVQISKDASQKKAEAEAEIAITEAESNKRANDARVQADLEIAQKRNELEIRQAELKREADIKKAESDAAYKIQEQEQRKTIEKSTAEANLVKQEKEIELKERAVSIRERELEATVKKEADAQKYAAQQQADAKLYAVQKQSEAELFERQRKAEAEKFEAEQKAEAQKAKSSAERFAKEQEAEAIKAAGLAEAEAVAAKGKAEAEAIQARAEAEAAGILKKAEAMKEYGDAARQQMELDTLKVYFEQLPLIAEAISKGYASVDSIKMFGGDASQLSGNIMTTLTQVTDGIKESTGIDPNVLLAGFLGGKMAQGKELLGDAPKENLK